MAFDAYLEQSDCEICDKCRKPAKTDNPILVLTNTTKRDKSCIIIHKRCLETVTLWLTQLASAKVEDENDEDVLSRIGKGKERQ